MVYLIQAYMLGVLVFAVTLAYNGRKLFRYLEMYHPEKVSEFRSFRIPFITRDPLYKEHGIDDPEFNRLLKRSRNMEKLLGLYILLPIFLIGFLVIVSSFCG